MWGKIAIWQVWSNFIVCCLISAGLYFQSNEKTRKGILIKYTVFINPAPLSVAGFFLVFSPPYF